MSLALTPDADRFPVRMWAVDAKPGTVLGEITPMSGSSWTVELDGGSCDLSVDLNLRLKDDSGWDWAAIATTLNLIDPCRRTLILTQGTTCLGEWLLTSQEPVGATQMRLSGVGWEKYPAMRQIRQRYNYTNVDQMTVAATVVADAFEQTGMVFTTPAPTTSGVNVTIDEKVWTTDYAAVLSQVCDTDDGLEWSVLTGVTWSAGVPVSVTRTVQWGHPELSRSSSITARRPEPGERGGNVTQFSRALDVAREAGRVVIFGSGSGKKQHQGSYLDEALILAGHLAMTRTFIEPSIKSNSLCDRKAKARVVATVAGLWEPAEVDLRLADTEAWPQVGDLIALSIARTPTLPSGAGGNLRAGAVSWTVVAGSVDVVSVKGVEQ